MPSFPQRIGILTSGGDAPGMNAAIRAAVRTALFHGCQVFSIRRGYQGMIEGDVAEMHSGSVANIINIGGTILKTARSEEFKTEEGRKKAFENLQKHGIDGLILIGGDGTFRGATAFFQEYDIPAIGLPGTIDKDLSGTDATIGFDTAVNTAIEAIDRLRDTATAHDRVFVVEVMGRDAGYIALHSGIGCGAEDILIPEQHTDVSEVLRRIYCDEARHKSVHILVVAEGDDAGGAVAITAAIKKSFPKLDVRECILGHIQRGGRPSAADRVLASRLGFAAVEALLRGEKQKMVGIVNNAVQLTPFDQVSKTHPDMDEDLLRMIRVLAT